MEKIAAVIGTTLLFMAFIVIVGPLAVVLGWLMGWAISITSLNGLLLGTLGKFGIHGFTLPELGALMGFFSAFLRTQTTVRNN